MDPEVPQEPQDQPAPEAPQPPIDHRAALEIAAQQYGVTPEELESSMRLQEENRRVYEENRRRARELELKEAEINALARERQRYLPPEPTENIDPILRPLFDKFSALEQKFAERDRKEREMERQQQENQRVGAELNSHFERLMRTLPTQNQMDAPAFYEAMQELWPNAEFTSLGISPAQAVERTARYLGIKTNGVAPQVGYVARTPRDPRAQFIVPMTGSAPPTGNGQPAQGQDFSPQRANESTEQYHQRLLRGFQELGTMKLPDGAKASSGW